MNMPVPKGSQTLALLHTLYRKTIVSVFPAAAVGPIDTLHGVNTCQLPGARGRLESPTSRPTLGALPAPEVRLREGTAPPGHLRADAAANSRHAATPLATTHPRTSRLRTRGHSA